MKASLYERIRSDYEARILSGEMAPGDRLPTEQELVELYGCSRMTVNKALTALAKAGLINRRKRAGTLVAQPRVHSMVLDIPDLAGTIRGRGQDYDFVLLKRRIRPRKEQFSEDVAFAAGSRLLELQGLHFTNAKPLAIEYRLIGLNAVPDMEHADLETTPPGTWLLQHIPWTEAETRIAAIAVDAGDAKHLRTPIGTACLQVERRTWRGTDPITYVRQIFLGDAYDLVARFAPGSGKLDAKQAAATYFTEKL